MEMFSIASSSSGNCICVGTEEYHVLIDVGITGKKIEEGLNKYGLSGSDIKAILITHEHGDHIKSLGVMSRKYHLPIYTTKGTWSGVLDCKSLGIIDTSLFHEVHYDEAFKIGPLTINPIKVSHDTNEPVAYVVSGDERRVAVITDLGKYDDYIVDNLQDLDAILLEANYDYNMLQVGRYEPWLKRRVNGDTGHLSNEMSGQLLCRIAGDKLKTVLLGHMSKENNVPELAYEAVRCEVKLSDTPYEPEDFRIICAPRYETSEKVVV